MNIQMSEFHSIDIRDKANLFIIYHFVRKNKSSRCFNPFVNIFLTTLYCDVFVIIILNLMNFDTSGPMMMLMIIFLNVI
jgi:hypothetical protein